MRIDQNLGERILWTVLVFALLIGELSMLSVDRNTHDASEKVARQAERDTIDTLSQVVLSTNKLLTLQDQQRKAEERRATKQLGEIKRQQDAAQLALNTNSRTLLLTVVMPHLIAEMQGMSDAWTTEDTTARHASPKGRYDPEYEKRREALAATYSAGLRPIMMNADSVRQQLLDLIPAETRSKYEYEQITPVFRSGVTGKVFHLDDLNKVIGYMKNLVRRISDLPPSK